MQGSFAIAYSDKDGSSFSPSMPWILDEFGDILSCFVKKNNKKLNRKGYRLFG